MTHDDLLRSVWRMHDGERMPISEIAKELRTSEVAVHACIIEVWNMTNAERVAVGVKPRRGWEDE